MKEEREVILIISGGQTGVDRAALDVGIRLGIRVGGWCPRGRKAEDGEIPLCYPMLETDSEDYKVRTEKNVKGSDGTLIIFMGKMTRGTALTLKLAQKHRKPIMIVQMDADDQPTVEEIRHWLYDNKVRRLNVAGPRESMRPGIYYSASSFLRNVLEAPC